MGYICDLLQAALLLCRYFHFLLPFPSSPSSSLLSMPTKRSSIDADLQPVGTRRCDVKRNKMASRPVLLSSDHSEASLSSSTNSGVFSDSAASDVTTASSLSSTSAETTTEDEAEQAEEEDESSSESDDSESEGSATIGDEADAEYEVEEEIEPVRVTSLARPNAIAVEMGRPKIDPDVVMVYAKELEARLHAFLPKLRKANSKLAENSASLNMEQVDDSEQHIEMNLDLGVLEQRQVEDETVTEGIRIPRRDAASQEDTTQLPPDVSVTGLLNGRREEAQEVKVEVLDDPGDPGAG